LSNGSKKTERTKRPTLVDVARLAGVDKALVSRVVNADPTLNIRPTTRERITVAIRELEYRPHAVARSLRTDRAKTVGLFVPDFANPVYAEIISGADAAALALGNVLMIGAEHTGNADPKAFLTLLDQSRVDGILLAGGSVSTEQQRVLTDQGVPWLLVNRRSSQANRYIVLDDEHASRLAVNHLIEYGHSRIAHVGGPLGSDTAERRRDGYLDAMKHAGFDDLILLEPSDYSPQGGAEATARLLESNPDISGIFVANVASAIGVLGELARRGVTVPAEVSVVALHDLPLAAHLVPSLTTVSMPLRTLGARAVDLLLSTDPYESVREVVSEPIVLIQRMSTGSVRA
jgi:LacI family transcriptional regulator